MSKTIFYKKIGRRYVPANVYSHEFSKAMPVGTTLTAVSTDGSSRIFNVDPEFAPLAAAALHSRQSIVSAVMKASEARPTNQALTEEQHEAWDNFIKVMGDSGRYIQFPSAMEVCDALTEKLKSETIKMLSVPAVKEAYEHFLFLYKMTKESQDND